jgi:hypothetical protein
MFKTPSMMRVINAYARDDWRISADTLERLQYSRYLLATHTSAAHFPDFAAAYDHYPANLKIVCRV